MNTQSKELTSCVCCGGRSLLKYLDLGMQPPPNSFSKAPLDVPVFPLETNVCTECFHSQISVSVDPSILFGGYLYRTGVSRTLVKHYRDLAGDAVVYYLKDSGRKIGDGLSVLDIGCNDCTLLKMFSDYGCRTTGVDPCCVINNPERGVDVFIEGFWNHDTLSFVDDGGYDIITATNVLAHNDDPTMFLAHARMALKDSGHLIVEFPYAADLFKHAEFDTIYHEHISYFLLQPFAMILYDTGLYINDIQFTLIHGGSVRLTLKKCIEGQECGLHCQRARNTMDKEAANGLLGIEFYKEFQSRVDEIRSELSHVVYGAKRSGKKIIGFGASGKSTVMLNYCDVTLQYIVDETDAKHGLYSPRNCTPIVPLSKLQQDQEEVAVIILAWNCMDECIRKIRQNRSAELNDDIITYIPKVERKSLMQS